MPRTTATRKLATLALAGRGVDLDAVVARLRNDGDGWRVVAKKLHEYHGIDIYWTTLMRWYTADVAA